MTQKFVFLAWILLSTGLLLWLALTLDSGDRAIAMRTLWLGLGAASIAVPGGAILALHACCRGKIAFLASAFCLVAVLVPVFAHVTAWDAAFGKLGLLTNLLGDVLKPIVSRWPAAIWIHSMIALPQVAILFMVAIRSGRQHWEDAVRLELSRKDSAIRIILWKYLPVGIAATLWTMISCAREIGVTDIYQIGTLSEQIYLGYSLGQLNAIGAAWTPEELAAAQDLGTSITLVIFALLSSAAIYLFFSTVQKVELSDSQIAHQPRRASAALKVVGLSLLFFVAFVPIANLFGRVGFCIVSDDGQPVAAWRYSSAIDAIGGVFLNFRDEFIWSFLIALVSATLVSALSVLAAWKCRRSRVGKLMLGIGFGLCVAMPGPSIGLAVGKVFQVLDYEVMRYLFDRTIAAPVIANAFFCLPISIPVFYFFISRVAADQMQHATLDGVSDWSQMFHLAVLAHWRSILGAWLLIVAFSFGELSATQMVLPPGMDTVPRLALGMLHAGVNESTAALTIVTLLPATFVALIAQFCFASDNGLRLR